MFLFAKLVTRLNAFLFRMAALAIFAIVALMVIEVAARYGMGKPTAWAPELAALMFGPYFLLGGAHLLHLGGHVSVDLVSARAAGAKAKVLQVLAFAMAAGFALVLLWFSLPLAIDSWQLRETSYSSWNPVIWPAKAMLPVSTFLLSLQALAEIIFVFSPEAEATR